MPEYVKNLWYMAAWDHEVPEEGFLTRKLLDRNWLIYQLSDGGHAMLEDRCPHRFIPLSLGKRRGDEIHCAYHGLGFGPDGRCVHSPFSNDPPEHVRATSLPVVARHHALWFWPGDPERADPSSIPDFAFLDREEPKMKRGVLHFAANYELVTDNLMDLSHAEQLHIETFGLNGTMFESGHQTVEDENGGLWNKWDMLDARAPAWAETLLPQGARIDQKLHMRWHAPATMMLAIALSEAGTGHSAPIVPEMTNPHIITPETQTTSHYFYDHDDTPEGEALMRRAFEAEDKPIVEAAQLALGDTDFWEARPAILKTDAAAIRARRTLMQLRKQEQGAR
jgi:phenylpropionate dioxygenase-like ring-hydroxylating dioxygenase large terminal subunit